MVMMNLNYRVQTGVYLPSLTALLKAKYICK